MEIGFNQTFTLLTVVEKFICAVFLSINQETGGTLDLGLGLKGQSSKSESPSRHKDEEPPKEKANQGRVWAFG